MTAVAGGAVRRESVSVVGRPANGYIPQLDGLRAVAVVLVLTYHFLTPIPFAGQVGVDVFFVLSGYLITSILLAEHERSGRIRLKLFYVRRAIRLYPPLLLVILVMGIFGVFFAPSLPRFLAETVFALTYTTPIILEFANGASVMWRHTWSLGVEEIFYLVWPLLLLVILRTRLSFRWASGVLLSVGFAMAAMQVALTHDGGGMSILLRSGGLLFGCAVALYLKEGGRRYAAAWGWAGVALVAVGIIAATLTLNESIGVALTQAGSTLLLLHAVTGVSGLNRALAIPPMTYVGRISYELYLWHFPVLVVMAWATGDMFIDVAWIAAPISVAGAVAAHHVLAPAIDRWKSRVLQWPAEPVRGKV